MSEKKPHGRPTKYKPEYDEQIIEFMGAGNSLTQFAAMIEVTRDTIYEWEATKPSFSDAVKIARLKCEAHWEKIGIEGMYMGGKDNPFQASMYIFKMKARFGWSDRQEVNVTATNDIKISIDGDDEDL